MTILAMDRTAACGLIGNRDISGSVGDDERSFFLEVVDVLDMGYSGSDDFHIREFEYSFVESEPMIRLLHLEFPKEEAGKKRLREIRERREAVIADILSMAERNFGCRYDADSCRKMLAFNAGNGSFPVQVGMECRTGGRPKVKVYLSVNAGRFPVKAFCLSMGIDGGRVTRSLGDRPLDAVAVDFLPGGGISIKLYPLTAENKGLLMRISTDGTVLSRKSWARLPFGLDIGSVSKNGFFDVPLSLRADTERHALRVSYLCLENGKRSVYFR